MLQLKHKDNKATDSLARALMGIEANFGFGG